VVAALLALCSAATYGIGDFCGGLAARRTAAASVLLWSHVVGLVLLGAAALLVAGEPTGGDLVIGAAGGLCGAAGVGLLYKGLSLAQMSAIAPITALLAAGVPVLAGYGEGERPGGGAVVGIVLALVAIVLVSAEGGVFVALSHTGDDAGLWPLVAARTASVTTVGVAALVGLVPRRPPTGRTLAFTASAGSLDALANLLYLLAVRQGLLTVVSVLTALYPVSTVALARVVLRERFHFAQRVGMAIAIPATVLMTV
jgi:drug/metabolite transporter (DMT)-like permease